MNKINIINNPSSPNYFFNFWTRQDDDSDWYDFEKFSIEGISDYTLTNEKHCTHLAPFADGLIALRSWYEPRKNYFSIKNIKLVDEIPDSATRKSVEFKCMYNQYLDYYNYCRDMILVQNNVKIININLEILREVLSYIFANNKLPFDVESYSWFIKLDNVISNYNSNCFVRSERVSAKNDSGKQIISSAAECLLHLGKSKDVLKSLCDISDEMTYIAVMPWNSKINLSNEFRIFVLNGKVKAISQQKWYVYAGLTREYVVKITPILFQETTKLVAKLPYLDASLDVWIDEKNKVHLIESNPGGRWCCSASMLFNWTDDTIWQDDGLVHVRYVEKGISVESSCIE